MEASGPAVVPAFKPARVPDHPPQTERGSTEKLALLWRERRFLWGVAWKTFLAAVVVSLLLPKHYEAITRIVPGEAAGASGLLGKLAGAGAISGNSLGIDSASILGIKTPGALYIEIMKSRTVQDQLIKEFDLQTHYFMGASRFPSLRGKLYAARKRLKSFTSFDEDRKSGVITITCTDYDQQLVAKICNGYVTEMNRLSADLNTSDAHRERIFLEGRLQAAKQDLDQAAQALSSFSSKNAVMDPQSQSRTMMDAAAKVQGELIVAETDLRGYQQIYSDDSIKVRTARARIGELQAQLRKLMGSSVMDSAGDPGTSSYPSMRALPLLGYQYGELYRQAKVRETVYEFLTQQYEMAKIQEAKELPTTRTMDVAVSPERKSGPSRILVVLLSLFGGLALACWWVIRRHAWDELPLDDPRRALAAEVSRDWRMAVRRMRRKAS
ncbi:MAG TPA: Wzz/FepE/Etk N-terminal domain-containing protein [Candidatus Angelobacter sp.]|nr:Wzz/FepE/Etk N-terminal domain-containing protein [Candidatus Angelobacter sp.]